jgi:hypothetical protein
MPTQLESAFQTTLVRIKNQQVERAAQAMEVLRWIFLAKRQLTVTELRHALSVMAQGPDEVVISAKIETLEWENFPFEESVID